MQCDSVAIEGLAQLFEIKRYPNSVWWYITDVHNVSGLNQLLYPTPAETPQYRMVTDSLFAPLAGRHLFRITPPNLMA